jgi:hypothetical protein
MACQVTILSVVPHGTPQQPVSSVDVKGTATGCATVQVSVSCGGSLTNPQNAPVDQQGNWSVTISDLTGTECNCGSAFMRVTARCAGNPNVKGPSLCSQSSANLLQDALRWAMSLSNLLLPAIHRELRWNCR